MRESHESTCPACGATEACTAGEAAERLRLLGKLRPTADQPEPEILWELFRAAAESMVCSRCGHAGLGVRRVSDDDEDWPEAAVCEICRRPIPAERIAALPHVTRCAGCQRAEEAGDLGEEPEYCPKCGSLMTLRPARGSGIARYVMACTGSPPCR